MPNKYERECGYDVMRLEPKVREKVIEDWREGQVQDDWWDFVYEDAKRMGALMGITIDDIQFTGFWSQGDGASFTGRYECKSDAVEAIAAECNDEELLRIARELTAFQVGLKVRLGCTFGCAIYQHRGNDVHSGTMYIGDWGREELWAAFSAHADDGEEAQDTLIKPVEKLMRALADWIYKSLQAEYEHLTSEEAVVESIRCSGLRFDSSGTRI